MPSITAIVPVYNVEKYIHRCVDSVLSQTFSDFELILVDDGSPDNCPAICDEYAAKDSRIRVIHQSNQGLSAVRNNAVKVAATDWVIFIDSDDVIHPQMLEHMYAAVCKSGAKICVCSVVEAESVPDGFAAPVDGAYSAWNYSEANIEKLCHTGRQKYWIGCAKLVRREIVEKLPFAVGRINEDNAVVFKWFYEANVVAEMEHPYYFYWVNPIGITKSQFTLKKLDVLWAYREQIDFYDSIGYMRMKRRMCVQYLETAAWYSGRVRNELNNYKKAAQIRREMRDLIRENPLDTLPLTEEKKEFIQRSFHPLREQLKQLPKNVAGILSDGGAAELSKRILRKFKRYG